jgi:hypothetical protein
VTPRGLAGRGRLGAARWANPVVCLACAGALEVGSGALSVGRIVSYVRGPAQLRMADEAKLAALMAKMDAARIKKGEAPANPIPEVEPEPTPLPEILPERVSRGVGDWRTNPTKLKELVDGTGGSMSRAEASVVLQKVRVVSGALLPPALSPAFATHLQCHARRSIRSATRSCRSPHCSTTWTSRRRRRRRHRVRIR